MSESKSTNSQSGGSCLPPLVVLLWVSAISWLSLGLLTGFLAALKMHATGLFANISWLNYGTLSEVSDTAILYGFVLQAVFAGSIWAISKDDNERPGLGHITTVGVVLWNKLLTFGCVQIFVFGTTGLRFMSLTPQALLGLLIASLFIVTPWVARLLSGNYKDRVGPCYLLLALLIFPMVGFPAGHFVHNAGVTGVMQNGVALWYGHILTFTLIPVFLIGTILFLLEQDDSIKGLSKSITTAALWCFILGGFLGGLYHGFPLGGGVNSLSVASTWFPAFGSFASCIALMSVSNQNKDSNTILGTFAYKWVKSGATFVLAINAITQLKGLSGGLGLEPLKLGLEQFLVFGSLLLFAVYLLKGADINIFKKSAPILFLIYLGSLVCIVALALESVIGGGMGIRMHVLGLLILLLASLFQLLLIFKSLAMALFGFLKGCCGTSESTEKSTLANA